MPEVRAHKELCFRSVHGGERLATTGALAAALRAPMTVVELKDIAGLAGVGVASPSHHQFGDRGARTCADSDVKVGCVGSQRLEAGEAVCNNSTLLSRRSLATNRVW